MGWNDPDNNQSPWGGKKQPPDLDEALKKLHRKVKGMFKKKTTRKYGATKFTNDGSGSFLFGIIVATIGILWLISGIFIVDPAEQAVILRFGKYIKTVGSGPHWIPRFIDSKYVVNVDRVSDYSYSAQMLTQDENLVSVSLAVQYRIGDLEQYLFNVADPEESLQQATSSALRQVVGATTLDQIITEGREAWGNSVQDALIHILSNYKIGIDVVNVSPQPARAPESVQDAFDDAIKAQEDEKRFKEQARAYEAKVVPIAVGNAKRIHQEAQAYSEKMVLQAKGETAEFLALLPEYLKSPVVTGERMYLDTMQRVLTKSSKILVDAKAGNMFYFPLDKIAMNRVVDEIPKSTDDMAAKSSNASSSFDGRITVRPTEQIGAASR